MKPFKSVEMKNQIFIFLLLLLFHLISCNNIATSGSPDDTMKGFVEKMKVLDFEGAKAFTNNVSDNTMDMLIVGVQILKDTKKEDQITALLGGVDFSKVTVTCVTNDARATCKCCEEDSGNCKDFSLVQEGGKWLINIPKETTIE